MAEIEFDKVSKVYDDGTQAVHDLDLEIEDGELMVEVGPSGCGKTTALRMLAGLEEISDGEIRIGERIVNDLTAKLRVQMRAEIHRLQRRLGVTTLYVTHDQVEAMTMGDRVAVMRDGRLQQVDTPQVLYDKPVNEFVAGFIGSPSINLVEAELARSNGGFSVTFGEHRLPVDDRIVHSRSGLERYVGRTIVLGIRPESFQDASLEPDAPPDRRIKTTADLTEPLGSEVLVYFTASATQIVSSAAAEHVADAVHLGDEDGGDGETARLVARVDPHTRIAEGTEIELAVDTTRLYFFDPQSREAI